MYIQKKKEDDKLSPHTGRPTTDPKTKQMPIRFSEENIRKIEYCSKKQENHKQLTAEVTDEKALVLLDRPEKFDLLMLCRIAEYADVGVMKPDALFLFIVQTQNEYNYQRYTLYAYPAYPLPSELF